MRAQPDVDEPTRITESVKEGPLRRHRPKFRLNIRLSSRGDCIDIARCTVIRLLVVAASIVIAASTAANAGPRVQQLVLRTYLPIRIALPDFIAAAPSEAESAHAISRIVASDLAQSGVFAPIDSAGFSKKNVEIHAVPQFDDWRAVDADELLVGRITRLFDARIKVEFRLWDTFNGKQLTGEQYAGTPDDLHRIGQMISERIYERITGDKRTFD